MFTAHQVVLSIVAMFLLFVATSMTTKNFLFAFIFQWTPTVLAFLVGLIVFNVF